MRVFLCGGVAIEADGRRLPDAVFAGRQGRLVLAYLVCERHRSVPREELAELLWGEPLPSSWSSSLSAVVSKLRRMLSDVGLDGPAALASAFGSYRLHVPDDTWIDWQVAGSALEQAERAVRESHTDQALAAAAEVEEIARRGFIKDDCLWADAQRERLRDMRVRAAHVRAEAHLLTGERRRAIEIARDALGLDELREASYRLLMRALAAAGERGEALRVWERCRTLLVDELGIDPATETEAVYLSILGDVAPPAPALPSGVVTFLLTDIVDSTGLWERNPIAMSSALERHDQIVTATVGANAGVLLKAKLEGDATVSVFPRASAGAVAALALREALLQEPWPEGAAPEVRMALHTGEAIERDGDYFGPALNRAARLRGLAAGGQILVSQAVAEVVRDHLPDGTVLRSLGERTLRGLTRDEHVFELSPLTADDISPAAIDRPALPAVLAGHGPFVGRDPALDGLATEWATAMAGTARAMFIAGEPGVGKTRLAGESARRAYDQGALVLYGRCDEELGAPYQPFAEALRSLVACLGARRLRSVRGVEELARLVPELVDLVPGLAVPAQASPDTERYALFDAYVRLLTAVSAEMPVLVVVDDLHWAAKPTLLLLRHLLRSAEGARLLIVGTYRQTDLDRTHPLAGTLADIHSDGTAERFTLTGLEVTDVNEYLSAFGYDDEHLVTALSTVTSGNPFFLIEVLRHVEETGGAWNPSTLPQGIREAVGRRLFRLSDAANDTLLVAAVAGSRFSIALVERVLDRDLIDAIGEACHAGLVVEEAGGFCRFDHALVRQSLLSEIASLKRVRLHQRIAEALEAEGAISSEEHLADLARHYFECALAGGAAKAVDYSRRAAEQATSRLAYEVAADFYDRALQAADVDGSGASDDDKAELLMARCEALLAAGDPTAAIAVVEQLQRAAHSSSRLSAWATCFAGQLAVLTHPERLDATANDVAAAAEQFALMDDFDGEAKAHTVRASCLARLGRVAECEAALDRALTAGRRAGDPRRVNAVLAGAPLAALWGPSPVARASGRCLDVVRVLRITTGSPAVEAVALRCQAVLEALRGRTEAARRMLGSAHRSLESLGHTHGLLETDLFSGMVELLAGEPGAAEVALRRAYEGFVSRGVGVDAAQAAALLARAVLAQGRVEAALALTDDSERLAGVDLQSAIAWRAARAEALAQQGRTAEALDAARTAVVLADPTDALIDQADAHLSLAIVLRAANNLTEAAREAARAIDLYERKGATARVEAVHALLNPPASEQSVPAASLVARRRVRPNRATEAEARGSGLFDADQWQERIAADYVEVDHRTHATTGADAHDRTVHMLSLMERFTLDVEPLASLGVNHALVRLTFHMEGARLGRDSGPVGDAELVLLEVARTDDTGRIVRAEVFEGDELSRAMARLIELHADDELPQDRHDGRYRIAAYLTDATPFTWSEDAVLVDRRSAGLGTLIGRDVIRPAGRVLRGVAPDLRKRIIDVLGSTEQVLLFEISSVGNDEMGGPFEMAMLAVGEFDDEGQQRRAEWYDLDRLDEALARFDELVGAAATPDAVVKPSADRYLTNSAERQWSAIMACFVACDWDGFAAKLAEDAVADDRRAVIGVCVEGRDAFVDLWRAIASVGVTEVEWTPLATRGDRLVLQSFLARGASAEGALLFVHEFDDGGLYVGGVSFDPDDLDAAFDELDARYAAGEASVFGEAWSVTSAVIAAYNARDWDAYRSLLADDLVFVDRQPAGWGTLDREAFVAAQRGLIDLSPDVRLRMVATARLTAIGTVCALRAIGTNETGGHFEIERLLLGIIRDGRYERVEFFAVDDLAAACDRFDALTSQPTGSDLRNEATRQWSELMACFRARDWDGFAARLADDVTAEDRRSLVGRLLELHEGKDACVEMWQGFATIGCTHVVENVVATRGDHLLLERALFVFGEIGAVEVEVLVVIECDDLGRWLAGVSFDPDDLDAAFAELDNRFAKDEAAALAPGLDENTASRMLQQLNESLLAHDWQAAGNMLAPDVVREDQRAGLRAEYAGRDQFLAENQFIFGAVHDVAATVVATRGDRLVLTSMHATGRTDVEGDLEFELLLLCEIEANHQIGRIVWFDADDLVASFAELDERYNATLPADHVDAWMASCQLIDRYNARDNDGLRAILSDECVIVDERLTGWGELDADTFVHHLQQLIGAVPDAFLMCVFVHGTAPNGSAGRFRVTGTVPGGGPFEMLFETMSIVRDGKHVRLELLPEGQIEEALRRLSDGDLPFSTL